MTVHPGDRVMCWKVEDTSDPQLILGSLYVVADVNVNNNGEEVIRLAGQSKFWLSGRFQVVGSDEPLGATVHKRTTASQLTVTSNEVIIK